jgi:NADH-quinone oxidoreductase subunit H
VILVASLIIIAYYTLLERKAMAIIQRRKGPNVVGLYGLGQPLTDGLKLLVKEVVIPHKANRGLFIAAPIITLFLSLTIGAVLPIVSYEEFNILDTSLDVLVLFALSSFGVYGIILSG